MALDKSTITVPLEALFEHWPNVTPNSPPQILTQPSPSYSPMATGEQRGDQMSSSLFQQQIDPEKELALWKFYDDIETDKCVKEYVNYLTNNRYFPRIPKQEKLASLPIPDYQLTKDCSAKVVSTFTDYFQSRYFCKNAKEALDANYALTKVHTNLQCPQYNQMPLKVFTDVAAQKESLALALQTTFTLGQAFVCELNLLRIYDAISNEVTTHVNNDDETEQNTDYFFLSHYVAARTNFMKQYKIKVIDWTAKPKKNPESLPIWRRKENGSPPKFRENRYAESLVKKIHNGKADLSAVNVLKEFNEFSSHNSNNKNGATRNGEEEEMEEEDTRHHQLQSKGRGYRPRAFISMDQRRREYKGRNKNGNFGSNSGRGHKRSENPNYQMNRERLFNNNSNHDKNTKQDKNAIHAIA